MLREKLTCWKMHVGTRAFLGKKMFSHQVISHSVTGNNIRYFQESSCIKDT